MGTPSILLLYTPTGHFRVPVPLDLRLPLVTFPTPLPSFFSLGVKNFLDLNQVRGIQNFEVFSTVNLRISPGRLVFT